jgi:SAM-dependent methyltransferase
MSTRWEQSGRPRAEDYDGRWKSLSAAGQNIHGEADLVEALLRESGGSRVLDAGCGTGRVAIELAARGFSVTGVDADAEMLAIARDKAPELSWMTADLADLNGAVDDRFDLVVLAGNVMIFLDPGTEERVLQGLAGRLVPGALLVAGFQLRPDRLAIDEYDRIAVAAGLESVARWSTWTRDPFNGADYAVSVHRRA